ncbi:hypothetical protein BD311DRAFT_193326 [Dichomitus squalens]|uniref:F-box domain-containing protein n=1 Tax=Dichomitus squalens TaxID=114155 RepID=A0A4Q9N6Q9_9APHY|nr:hypothetical protein BD311DRAFT_193326 [Dichomitus squalens]
MEQMTDSSSPILQVTRNAHHDHVFRWLPEDEVVLRTLLPSNVQSWARSKIDYHTEYTRRLSSTFNSGALVHLLLPTEMLMEIFSRIEPQSCHDIRILHVCRKWRSIILRTPAFWQAMLRLSDVMDDSCPSALDIQVANEILRLFAPRKIDVTVMFSSDLRPTILVPHLSRITTLTICMEPDHVVEVFEALRSFRMVHLTRLVIEHEHDESTEDNIEISSAEAR